MVLRINGGLRQNAPSLSFPPHSHVALVTDTNVAPLYAHYVENAITRCGATPYRYTVPPGEEAKSLNVYSQLIDFLTSHGFSRTDCLVALGGGVVGDLTGFAAATYLRGIDYIQIPTTLLSCIDAGVGGKTALNTPRGKNLIGAFHQPKCVYIDSQTLRTLPPQVLRDGMGEAVKYAVLCGGPLWDLLEKGPQVHEPQVQGPQEQEPRVQGPQEQEPRVQGLQVQEPQEQEPQEQRPQVQEPQVQEPQVQEPQVQEPQEQRPQEQRPQEQELRVQDPLELDAVAQDPSFWDTLISLCIDYKLRIVAADEKDTGVRHLLNLGHTLGHAIEHLSATEAAAGSGAGCAGVSAVGGASDSLAGTRTDSAAALRHGHCVAIGLHLMARASHKAGYLSKDAYLRIRHLLERYGLPLWSPYSPSQLQEVMATDKKHAHGRLQAVWIYDIGQCRIQDGSHLIELLDN